MPAYREVKPKQKEELALNERYQSITNEYQEIGYKYVLSRQEKEELIFEKYKNKFPHTYKYDIQHIFRIKHNKDEFLVYRIIEEVTDSNNTVHTCERQVGWHSSPTARIVKDQLDNVTESSIRGHRIVYEIPFTREALRKIIDGSRSIPSDLCVGIGSNNPPDIISSNPQKIWNEDEFVEHDFDDLFGASVAGYSRTGYGGVKEYKEAQQKRLEAGQKAVDEAQAKHQKQVQAQQRQAQS